MRHAFVVFAIAMLVMPIAACRSTPVAPHQPLASPGTIIRLKQTLPVRAHYARVFIQDGEVVNKPYLYRTWCTLHIYRLRADMANEASINADEFTIAHVYRRIDYSWTTPVLVAHHDWHHRWWDRSNVTFSTYFQLHSDNQPNVRRLVCSIFADPGDYAYPRMPDIRAALGGLAEFDE